MPNMVFFPGVANDLHAAQFVNPECDPFEGVGVAKETIFLTLIHARHMLKVKILVLTSPYFSTISSQISSLSLINSTKSTLSSSFSSNPTNSTSKTSLSTFHILFHVNKSPLVQLNAWFLALSVTAAHTCCCANTSESVMSQKCSHVYRVPGRADYDGGSVNGVRQRRRVGRKEILLSVVEVWGYVGEAGRRGRFECGENVVEHGFVGGNVGFFVFLKLKSHPEEKRCVTSWAMGERLACVVAASTASKLMKSSTMEAGNQY
ncbi:hypothetical protein Ahy_B01g055568 isoform A [Arachis hypogaea]|uniref:Uncharacterized protein n=1 Tax=Arachis hypogaea TaxID=3818 RepID=A0A445AWI2_ARAHY|nr:hypothetical protein Ahy_B01g055568 isoform A [Arachis hypogaea]